MLFSLILSFLLLINPLSAGSTDRLMMRAVSVQIYIEGGGARILYDLYLFKSLSPHISVYNKRFLADQD